MAVSLKLLYQTTSRRRVERTYKVILSSTYAAGGQVMSLNADMSNINNLPNAQWGRIPDGFTVDNHPQGFVAVIVPGVLLTDWKLMLFQSDDAVDPLDEFAAGAYSAGLLADTGIRITLSGPIGV